MGVCEQPVLCSDRLIKGFIHRHEEYGPDNDYFLDHVRCSFLKTLRRNLPRSVLDKSWPTPPPALTQVLLSLTLVSGTHSLVEHTR